MSAGKKIQWLKKEHGLGDEHAASLANHLHPDSQLQERYNEFSENTVSNFFIPYGLAPNFLINQKWYVLPMAIEESSVVAAASHAAKFWASNGGFSAEIIDTIKTGQVHFFWNGDPAVITELFRKYRKKLMNATASLTASMQKRGGGLTGLEVIDMSDELENYFQLNARFKTADAMGANFINTVLERLAVEWKQVVEEEVGKQNLSGELEISMAILSNYTPECIVRVMVKTGVGNLEGFDRTMTGRQFAEKFVRAIRVAHTDRSRAVTHNKGIFNGMDGVVIATGNDFRAVEACGHAYAARDGNYRSLSDAGINKDTFWFKLEVPMSVGTVGGLTTGHPLARASLELLGNPPAEELMMIIAAAGLANNFSAVRSLITSGIQKGHMKMHLSNILRQLDATDEQRIAALEHFKDKQISFSAVEKFITAYR